MLTRRSTVSALALSGAGLVEHPQQYSFDLLSPGMNISSLCGFNISTFYRADQLRVHSADDLKLIRDLGFGAVRVPIDYRIFFKSLCPTISDDESFRRLDELISHSLENNLHVILCMHRAPGFCVNPPYETESLWSLKGAFQRFLDAWDYFGARYSGVSSQSLSFNLVNEPPSEVSEEIYFFVMWTASNAIRKHRPDRAVIIDGLSRGTREPSSSWGIRHSVFSTRGYFPSRFTHFGAEWLGKEESPKVPSWPFDDRGTLVDQGTLERRFKLLWARSIANSTPIIVGEWGVYNRAPYPGTLAFMADSVAIWKRLGWGWFLWNFRGPFGLVDSGRSGAKYEKVGGYLVDTEMLEILRPSN